MKQENILYKFDNRYPDIQSNQYEFEHWALETFLQDFPIADCDSIRLFSSIVRKQIKKYGTFYRLKNRSNRKQFSWIYVYNICVDYYKLHI